MKQKNLQHYDRLGVIPVDILMNLVPTEYKFPDPTLITFFGIPVSIIQKKLKVFKLKGTNCVHCGLKGAYFAVEKARNTCKNRYHINLYTNTGRLINLDHIIPRSLGGTNYISNLQPMCVTCNNRKGNSYIFNSGRSLSLARQE